MLLAFLVLEVVVRLVGREDVPAFELLVEDVTVTVGAEVGEEV